MKRTVASAFLLLGVGLMTCSSPGNTNSSTQQSEVAQPTTSDMNSFISIFEIPATEISRAIRFYEAILDIKIEQMEIPEMQMGIFPYEGQMVTGVIIKGEGYEPTANGVTIYLNGGDNLQVVLDKVVANGGQVLVPKTPHADEVGYFAMFLDTEGNRLGLHSPN